MSQCKLHGKAQEAVAALSLEESLSYDSVKSAILRMNYELVPEAYRQQFRNHTQTFFEFAQVLEWITAGHVDFSLLLQMILLEKFKKYLPEHIVVYLNEQKANSLSTAAVLADEYAHPQNSFPMVFY